jgi:hypothetical protein
LAWVISRICEEFHIPVRQALEAMDPDVDTFDAVLVADECAALMFEVMDCRSFAAARKAYQQAKAEEQFELAKEHPMVALVQEIDLEVQMARKKAAKANRA